MERDQSPQESLLNSMRGCIAAWDAEAIVRSRVRGELTDITVVSQRFEGFDSRDREKIFWPVLDDITKSEMLHLTYCLLLTPEEATADFSTEKPDMGSAAEDWDE